MEEGTNCCDGNSSSEPRCYEAKCKILNRIAVLLENLRHGLDNICDKHIYVDRFKVLVDGILKLHTQEFQPIDSHRYMVASSS